MVHVRTWPVVPVAGAIEHSSRLSLQSMPSGRLSVRTTFVAVPPPMFWTPMV
jgi:hypothetical protein